MYPEGAGAGAEPADYGGGSMGSKVGVHLEGLIPLILIIIIVFFGAVQFGIINSSTPVIGSIADLIGGGGEPASMLLIGNSSQEVRDVLNESKTLVKYRIKTADDLARNPVEQLAQYDIVMLDQSQESDKTVSYELGEAIKNYVSSGGKLIVVLNSGIMRKGAYDVLGWKATFGDVVPVDCDRTVDNRPVCTQTIAVRGRIYSEDDKHAIMKGFEVAPAQPDQVFVLETLDVTPTGKELAYIKDEFGRTPSYPAIVEKPLVMGKSIYFNYNPGKTKGILQATLRYLK
ncbi:MAG: hypothetical protein V1494_02240 [Candidatus Diapherotrites archaeon]